MVRHDAFCKCAEDISPKTRVLFFNAIEVYTELLYAVGKELIARSTRKLGRGRRKESTVYPLSSMVYCAHCEELARQQGNQHLRSRLVTRSKGAYYVHRHGINCGRSKGQIPRKKLEEEFLALLDLLTVDEELFGSIVQLAAESGGTFQDDKALEVRRAKAIEKSERRLEAARHLYEDGDISREEYLRRKKKNETEIAQWRDYTTETQRMAMQLVVCVEALRKLSEVWRGSSDEDRNRTAKQIFEYIVYDLDQAKIVDFKLHPTLEQYLVLRVQADGAGDEANCLNFDPGRIRTFDTPLKRRVLCL